MGTGYPAKLKAEDETNIHDSLWCTFFRSLIFFSGLVFVGGCSTFDFESHSARPWNHPTTYEVERATSIYQPSGYPPAKPTDNYP